jgi:hypothetical protein
VTGRGWREDWSTHAGVVAVIALGLGVVVLAVFAYLVPLSRGQDVTAAQAGPTAAVLGAPGGQVLPSPRSDAAPVRYVNGRYGFEMAVPAGWRRAELREAAPPARAADYDLVWEDPATGARISVSAWDSAGATSFLLWSAILAGGMEPVAGIEPVAGQAPTNALVAGRPALLVRAPETPATPARYAAFFEHEGSYFRVEYSAQDGGAALTDFARALLSLRWPAEPPVDAVLPLRGAEISRYWPAERLFR